MGTLEQDAHRTPDAMSKHSPAPWALSRDERPDMEWNIHIVQRDAPHLTVCFMTSDGPNEANATLIASAPELLEALTELLAAEVAQFPPYEAGKEAQDAWSNRRAAAKSNARTVIAKATGAV